MGMGYFIRQGDKTTCGGLVLEGDTGWICDGAPLACEGHRVSCGEDGESYTIAGGVDHFGLNGRRAAGSLDSFSTCPCNASLIASRAGMAYGSNRTPAASRSTPSPAAQPRVQALHNVESANTRPSGFSSARLSAQSPALDHVPQEPGFYIVEKSVSREQLQASLLSGMSPAARSKFHSLNPGSDLIKAGSLIVLSDPNNYQCAREEALLMSAATSANQTLDSLSAEEADFMMRHRDEIATFLGHGSTAGGVAEVMMARHLKNVGSLLKDIERLHLHTFQKYGHLKASDFFAERKHLFKQLDFHLNGLTARGIGIPDHPSLKRALGISSQSLVHHWTKAGAAGAIPGYSDHLSGVAKASKIIALGGWIGTGVGGTASYLEVQEVCATESSEACEKVKFTETGSFTGSWVGGIAGGAIGARVSGAVAGAVCVGLGPVSAGAVTLGCGLVVVGAGALVGGFIGGYAGEEAGELIYRANR